MHSVAYQRCHEVAKGIIPFNQGNLMNLISQTRSFYEPDFQVVSLSEQVARLKHVRIGQDYIQDWFNAWNVEHYFEAGATHNHEATAVYFDKETNMVLFTQLFAMISEIPTHSTRL